MLAIGLAILLIGLILLGIALRGRTIARGRFCRKCRFDLAGLDPVATPACPECGHALGTPKSTRPSIRRTSRPALVISAVLLLTGIGLSTAGIANNGPRVMAALPDSAVLLLHRAGLDAGLTEVAARSARTPPLRDAAWPRLIEQSLGHQADRTELWDLRHGEILANAYRAGRMTEPQIARYLHHGYAPRLILRGRALHGRPIPFEIEYIADRITMPAAAPTALSKASTRHSVRHWFIATGLAELPAPDAIDTSPILEWTAERFPGQPWPASIRIRGEIGVDTRWRRFRSVDDIGVFIEIGSELVNHGQAGALAPPTPIPAVRLGRTLRVDPPDASVVTIIEDDELADRMRSQFAVGALRLLDPGDKGRSDDPGALGMVVFKPGDRLRDVSGTLFVRSGGLEHPLRMVSIGSSSIDPGGVEHVMWRAAPEDLGRAGRLAVAWIDAGRVDLVFRTDPSEAYRDPRIGSVLRVDMVFENVPVQVVGSTRELAGPDGGIRVPAGKIPESEPGP